MKCPREVGQNTSGVHFKIGTSSYIVMQMLNLE